MTLAARRVLLWLAMGNRRSNLFLTALIFSLAACGATGPVEDRRKPRPEEIARSLGCARDEVAVCIEINCDAEDYQCAPRGSARDMLSGEFEPPQR